MMTTSARNRGVEPWGPLDAGQTAMIDGWAQRLGLTGKAVLTMAEAAAILRISERSVREGIKAGRIPSVRLGRRVLIPVPTLLALLLDDASSARPT